MRSEAVCSVVWVRTENRMPSIRIDCSLQLFGDPAMDPRHWEEMKMLNGNPFFFLSSIECLAVISMDGEFEV